MSNLSKKTLGGRVDAELYDKVQQLAAERGVQQSDVLREIVQSYFEQPETIVEDEWVINIRDCSLMTIAAFYEMQDKKNITKNEILDCFVRFIQKRSGDIEERYLPIAKAIKEGSDGY